VSHYYLRLALGVLLERAQFYDELVMPVFELAAGRTISYPSHMATTDKRQQLIDQVISKIHWGTTEANVRRWLEEEKGMSPATADHLLGIALAKRAASIRVRAIVMLVISIPGMILVPLFFVLMVQSKGATPIFFTPHGLVVVGSIFVGSIVLFFRSIYRLLSGRKPGSAYD